MKSHIRKQSLRKFLSRYYVRIFPFHHGPLWSPIYYFAESTTAVLGNCSKNGSVELCVMKSHIRKQSLRKLLSSYYVRIFPFHHGPLWAPKHYFPESTKRVFANCFLKSKLYVCEMNSQIRKKFLGKLLSCFERMKFPLSA